MAFRILSENQCLLVPLQHPILYSKGSVFLQNHFDENKRLRVAESTPVLRRVQHVAAYETSRALGKQRYTW